MCSWKEKKKCVWDQLRSSARYFTLCDMGGLHSQNFCSRLLIELSQDEDILFLLSAHGCLKLLVLIEMYRLATSHSTNKGSRENVQGVMTMLVKVVLYERRIQQEAWGNEFLIMIVWSSFDGIRLSVNSRTNSSLVGKNCDDCDPMREGPFVFF